MLPSGIARSSQRVPATPRKPAANTNRTEAIALKPARRPSRRAGSTVCSCRYWRDMSMNSPTRSGNSWTGGMSGILFPGRQAYLPGAAGVPALSSPHMLEGTIRRNLWPLVLGQSVSLLGDYLGFFLALPVFVRDASGGSATQLGLLGTFETVAVLGFGLIAGLVIDRSRVRRTMVIADLARAAAFALLALAVALDVGGVWMAFAVAFLV